MHALGYQVGRKGSKQALHPVGSPGYGKHMLSGPDAMAFSGNGVWDVREGKPLSEYVTGEERLLGDLHQQGHYTCREVWELRPRNSVEANWRAFLYQTNAPAHV